MPNFIQLSTPEKDQEYACGQLFRDTGELMRVQVYILAHSDGRWALVSLHYGNTFNGFCDSVHEAFNGKYSRFERVFSSVTLTPQN